ncbi:hypothetical protein BLOT_010597 [Blomia tropicalis]|nr:hypothetical protein BLOT_010597 [Blomia tropicalis]
MKMNQLIIVDDELHNIFVTLFGELLSTSCCRWTLVENISPANYDLGHQLVKMSLEVRHPIMFSSTSSSDE